jgi:hypothetical protein
MVKGRTEVRSRVWLRVQGVASCPDVVEDVQDAEEGQESGGCEDEAGGAAGPCAREHASLGKGDMLRVGGIIAVVVGWCKSRIVGG